MYDWRAPTILCAVLLKGNLLLFSCCKGCQRAHRDVFQLLFLCDFLLIMPGDHSGKRKRISLDVKRDVIKKKDMGMGNSAIGRAGEAATTEDIMSSATLEDNLQQEQQGVGVGADEEGPTSLSTIGLTEILSNIEALRLSVMNHEPCAVRK